MVTLVTRSLWYRFRRYITYSIYDINDQFLSTYLTRSYSAWSTSSTLLVYQYYTRWHHYNTSHHSMSPSYCFRSHRPSSFFTVPLRALPLFTGDTNVSWSMAHHWSLWAIPSHCSRTRPHSTTQYWIYTQPSHSPYDFPRRTCSPWVSESDLD